MHNLSKKGPTSARSETVGVRLEPKMRYLVELAARDQQRTVSSFIEWAVRKVLTSGEIEVEPCYGIDMGNTPKILWGEGYWDSDPADRLYLLATSRRDLLTEHERNLWKLLSESILITGRKLDLPTFRAAFHDPMVCTTHLESEAENA